MTSRREFLLISLALPAGCVATEAMESMSTVPFQHRFVEGTGASVVYEVADFELAEGMIRMSYIFEHMDMEAKFTLVPDPGDEVIAKYYADVQAAIENAPMGPTSQDDMELAFPPPWPDRESQILPEPIWTNVTVSGEDRPGFVIFTRVYGGVLKPEYDADAWITQKAAEEDGAMVLAGFPTPFGRVML